MSGQQKRMFQQKKFLIKMMTVITGLNITKILRNIKYVGVTLNTVGVAIDTVGVAVFTVGATIATAGGRKLQV